jgi:hypothetical protein
MISPKEKAEELVHTYRVLLMDEGEDYGEEILVSMLSKQCALISAMETKLAFVRISNWEQAEYWRGVEREIGKL